MTMSLRTLLMAGGVLCAAVLGGPVAAQQVIEGVGLVDPETVLQQSQNRSFGVNVRDDHQRRIASPANTIADDGGDTRQVELEFAASGDRAGVPLDVSVARRASFRADRNGDVEGGSAGSEVRIGRGLVRQDDAAPSDRSSVYLFVADEDEALTWSPGQRTANGRSGRGLALQEDRVEVGDSAMGVTYERNGIQASLAYVERSIATEVGTQTFSQDESFTGLTVTMRR